MRIESTLNDPRVVMVTPTRGYIDYASVGRKYFHLHDKPCFRCGSEFFAWDDSINPTYCTPDCYRGLKTYISGNDILKQMEEDEYGFSEEKLMRMGITGLHL